MRVLRVLGWILCGLVIGVLGDKAIQPVHAQYLGLSQQRVFEVGDIGGTFAQPRSVEHGNRYTFVKDSKSGACWIKYEWNIGGGTTPAAALAVAPPEACQ